MSTIPANLTVDVTPGVLGAGGSALALNGMVLTQSTRVPIGTVMSFGPNGQVGSYFGANSHEAIIADGGAGKGSGYFGGFDGSNVKPATLYYVQYPSVAVAAYLRGGNISALPLASLQAINGTLSVIVDGYPFVASSLNLSGAVSFSSAAGLIGAALNSAPPTEATITTGSISGTTLTVTTLASGVIAPGQTLIGSGVTSGTIIESQLTGTTGGTGTYLINLAQTVGGEAMTTQPTPVVVTFDSVSGAFIITSGTIGIVSSAAFATGTTAAALLLTSATGAVISQGAAATTPAAFMAQLTTLTQNWATFMTGFDPDGGSGHVNKEAFSAWANSSDDRYAYVCFDTDASPTVQNPATGSLGFAIGPNGANYSGTILIYEPSDQNAAAFVMGAIASIDFTETEGRTNLKFRSQTGLQPGVTTQTAAINLGGNPQITGDKGNGYNFYGANATANNGFTFFANGVISGPFEWIDTYVNQIWLTNQFQLDLMEYLTQAKSVPFNPAGYAAVEASLNDTINQAINFGAIRQNVTLSATQISAVNAAAGQAIDSVLSTRGWYLAITPASPTVRQGRGPLAGTFFYTDGGSVNSIDLASIVLL